MSEWLVEDGIGERRAILIDGDTVLAARMRWPDELEAGMEVSAKLAAKPAGGRRGTAIDARGREILLNKVPTGTNEGQRLVIRVTRAAIAETGRFKRAQGRVLAEGESGPEQDDPVLTGRVVRRFPDELWEDVWTSAGEGVIDFTGGTLLFSVTPAMTVVDIDGTLPPRDLALAAVPALARAVGLFSLGGSIGIDFPTLSAKADRRAVDEALGAAFGSWPHERTAMNGFGFVQIVARLEGPSLLHRLTQSPAAAAARMVLRRAEGLAGAGAVLLTVNPTVEAALKREWLAELERRTGRQVRIAGDPSLAITAASAQIVPHA